MSDKENPVGGVLPQLQTRVHREHTQSLLHELSSDTLLCVDVFSLEAAERRSRARFESLRKQIVDTYEAATRRRRAHLGVQNAHIRPRRHVLDLAPNNSTTYMDAYDPEAVARRQRAHIEVLHAPVAPAPLQPRAAQYKEQQLSLSGDLLEPKVVSESDVRRGEVPLQITNGWHPLMWDELEPLCLITEASSDGSVPEEILYRFPEVTEDVLADNIRHLQDWYEDLKKSKEGRDRQRLATECHGPAATQLGVCFAAVMLSHYKLAPDGTHSAKMADFVRDLGNKVVVDINADTLDTLKSTLPKASTSARPY